MEALASSSPTPAPASSASSSPTPAPVPQPRAQRVTSSGHLVEAPVPQPRGRPRTGHTWGGASGKRCRERNPRSPRQARVARVEAIFARASARADARAAAPEPAAGAAGAGGGSGGAATAAAERDRGGEGWSWCAPKPDGFKYVSFDSRQNHASKPFKAELRDGSHKYLGTFATPEEAAPCRALGRRASPRRSRRPPQPTMTAAEAHATAAAEGLELLLAENVTGFKNVSRRTDCITKPFHAVVSHGGRDNHRELRDGGGGAGRRCFLGPEASPRCSRPPRR